MLLELATRHFLNFKKELNDSTELNKEQIKAHLEVLLKADIDLFQQRH